MLKIIGYSDSDWAMDIYHRSSIIVLFFLLSGAVLAGKTRVQSKASLSSAEAEFLAVTDCRRLALFLRSVLLEFEAFDATPIFEENRA